MVRLAAALALALALAASPAAAHLAMTAEPVACVTPQALWIYLDAFDAHDGKSMARQLQNGCAPLANREFVLVAEQNGVATIRVFHRHGDWDSSQLAYTLDEMVDRAGGGPS